MALKPRDTSSFWKTLPGVLTGLAALLTAIVGLLGLTKEWPPTPQRSLLAEDFVGTWRSEHAGANHLVALAVREGENGTVDVTVTLVAPQGGYRALGPALGRVSEQALVADGFTLDSVTRLRIEATLIAQGRLRVELVRRTVGRHGTTSAPSTIFEMVRG